MEYSLLSFYLPFTAYPFEGNSIACPVCAHDDRFQVSTLDRRFKRLTMVGCERCGLVYVNPMPSDEELEVYYSKFYRFDYQVATKTPKNRHLRKRVREAEHRIDAVEDILPRNARTLDFGCGSGEFVAGMAEKGHDSNGFEPGETYGKYSVSRLGDRVQIAGWQDVKYEGTFDLVTCFHVLEHLRDPVSALRQMRAWAGSDGYVYVEIPDMGQTMNNKGIGGFHFGHLTNFNHYNLILAAGLAGLTPKKIVSPTCIIFSTNGESNTELMAAKGRELSRSLYADGLAVSNYWRYQANKLMGKSTR